MNIFNVLYYRLVFEESILPLNSTKDRIGHGTILWCPLKYINNDIHKKVIKYRQKIFKILKEKNIEICPTSNLILNNFKSYEEIDINYLLNNNVKISINKDNKRLINTNVNKEYKNIKLKKDYI